PARSPPSPRTPPRRTAPRGSACRRDRTATRAARAHCRDEGVIIAQLSDPHIKVGANDEGSAAALARAVDAVLALTPLPAAVVVTGDLAEHAAAAEYERFAELVAPLPMP